MEIVMSIAKAILTIVFSLLLADGSVNESEYAFIDDKLFPELVEMGILNDEDYSFSIIKKELEEFKDYPLDLREGELEISLYNMIDADTGFRKWFVLRLIDLAVCDNKITKSEKKMLISIADGLNFILTEEVIDYIVHSYDDDDDDDN